jgi:hypothetical protein
MRCARIHRLAIAGAVIGACGAGATSAPGQDAQYWSIQYGPAGQLLGGQVVGSSRDLSATYYDPGGLALAENPEFLLSVQGFELQRQSFAPVEGGPFLNQSQTSFDAFPGFFAFAFPEGWLGRRTRLAFSVLTRQQYNGRIDQRFAGRESASSSGLEILFDERMSETWGGLTLSHRVSDRLGLGVTLYGVYRGQRTRREQSFQQVGEDGSGVSALAVDDFDYSHWRALAKLGAAWEGRAVRLGFAVTTPSAALFGSGDLGYTRSATGVDVNGDGRADDLLVNGLDEGIDSRYESSWAVAGGAAWRRGSLQLQASAEWFAPVSFTVLQGTPDATTGQPVSVVQDLRSVLNAGVGVEYWPGGASVSYGTASDRTVVYGAFATDFSASPSVLENEASSVNMNLYHLTGGVGFSLGSSRFSLGVDYAFGSKERQIGLGGLPSELSVIAPQLVRVHASRWVFALGYLFGKS